MDEREDFMRELFQEHPIAQEILKFSKEILWLRYVLLR